MVARRRFLKKNSPPPTPSPTPTPPSSPLKIPTPPPSPPPQPSPPPSPPPPPPQPSPPPSPPKTHNPPPSTSKHRFKTFASKPPATKPFVRKPTTRSAKQSVPKSIPPPSPRRSQHSVPSSSAATPPSTSQPRKRKTAGTTGKHRSKSLNLVKVLSGRVYEDEWISRAEFKFLKESLENQGWLRLLNYNDAIYEDEVRQFYSNLVISKNLVLSSTVNETVITLTVQELGQLLEVPSAGFSDLPYQTWPFVFGVDNATISRAALAVNSWKPHYPSSFDVPSYAKFIPHLALFSLWVVAY
ncbi:uncharacterized protein LOC125496431 [Beta vulgaris subsp. vulgaris]|uniref:uncharacterized protein LOC125496431 n=1 Tax=Beta vulgaris subsp. vulgaris TaxID=3555 RepID=UPI002036B8FD|nr:uncharacterized protein LOC125496431 [Beta vulgaris subsp. vulgaris]